MAVQHADIFHCQTCGRVAYEAHGNAAPSCCGQPMVRAVTDVVQAVAGQASERDSPLPHPNTGIRGADVEDYALLAEVIEVSNWCHTIEDIDIARYDDLSQRLQALHRALADKFDEHEQTDDLAKLVALDPRHRADVDRLHEARQAMLSALHGLIDDLRGGESHFGGWAEVCERLDLLATEFRRHEQSEADFIERATREDRKAHN